MFFLQKKILSIFIKNTLLKTIRGYYFFNWIFINLIHEIIFLFYALDILYIILNNKNLIGLFKKLKNDRDSFKCKLKVIIISRNL